MNPPAASTPPVETSEPHSEPNMRLHGFWSVLARVVFLALCVFSVVLYIASVLSYIANDYCMAGCYVYGLVVVRTIHVPGLGIYTIARDSLFSLVYWLVAAFLFWRKSDDRMALLAAVTLGTFPIMFNNGFISTLPSSWEFPALSMSFLANLFFALFFYVFPDGSFVPGWMRWIFIATIAVPAFTTLFPFYYSEILSDLVFIVQVVSVIAVQIYRYRWVSGPVQRQQTRWVVYGVSLGWIGYLALLVIRVFFPTLYQTNVAVNVISGAVLYGLVLLVPFFIGIAIVRARLWDIDILINRTLVYGILTVCVVGLYVLVVESLGALIGIFGISGNLFISLLATGLVAVLFQPLRALLQRGVNRLLYGQRNEPYAVITRLSQRLEGTLAPDAVLSTIVETVAQALKLPYVAIFFKQEDTFRLAASFGELVEEPLVLPLAYQAETIGQMRLAPRAPGESFTPADRRLLDELARQAGLAAHAIRLNADLQRSYELLEQRVVERTRELSSLLEISHTVASTLQLKPLLGLILDQLKLVVDYTGSSILTVDGDYLVFLDNRNPVPQEELMPLRFPVKDLGLIWETLLSGEPLIVPDISEKTPLAQSLRTAMGDLLATTFQYVHCWMGVPLMLRDKVIGMLVLTSSQEQVFTEHHAALALAIANQAAIAIENARLYEQAQELAAVEERQKLARELHDSVSQALYGIALGLHTARIQLDRDQQKLPASLDDLLSLSEAALAEMRALIFELRPESLEREGVVAALARQGAALQARHEIIVQTELCEEPALPLKAKQELYRIAQEALHNTVKHAHARRVDLILRRADSAVILEVRDDGVGFDPSASYPGHLGLRSMQERVSHLGGSFQIESAPGEGTHVFTQVPLEQSSENVLENLPIA